jgi:DNA-binding transcriptional ArsR family regulator
MNTTDAVSALAALAQETRLAIYRLLVERGPGGAAAGAVAEALKLPASSLSFHLAHLTRAGLIVQRRVGRQLFYSADFAAMNALVGYLTENCCSGNPALCVPACAPAPEQPPKRKSS